MFAVKSLCFYVTRLKGLLYTKKLRKKLFLSMWKSMGSKTSLLVPIDFHCMARNTFFFINLFVFHRSHPVLETTWGWVNYDRIFIFGWSISLIFTEMREPALMSCYVYRKLSEHDGCGSSRCRRLGWSLLTFRKTVNWTQTYIFTLIINHTHTYVYYCIECEQSLETTT